jgi:hypothetical protein
MQAVLKIYCEQDGKYIGQVKVDTADMPEQLQEKVNKLILGHRKDCPYYSYRAATTASSLSGERSLLEY